MIRVILLIVLFSSMVVFAEKSPVKISITVTNIKDIKGIIYMSVYNKPKGFLDIGEEIKLASKKVTGSTVTFEFMLSSGVDYAFAFFQDLNSDKLCNLNFIGIPKEPYGFSNVFSMIFSKPKFKNCKIHLDKPKDIKTIPLY